MFLPIENRSIFVDLYQKEREREKTRIDWQGIKPQKIGQPFELAYEKQKQDESVKTAVVCYGSKTVSHRHTMAVATESNGPPTSYGTIGKNHISQQQIIAELPADYQRSNILY